MTTDVQELWQAHGTVTYRPSADVLRALIERHARRIRLRNDLALGVCAVVIIGAIWWLVDVPDLLARVGAILTLVGIGAILVQVRVDQGDERTAVLRAALMGGTSPIEFYRRELQRQRDFHRGWRFWSRWSLFVPGPILFFIGFAKANSGVFRAIEWEVIVFVLFALAAVPLNLRLARRYQRQITDLDQLDR